MSTRQEKVKELLKIEVSDILRKEIKDPRLGFITITDAQVSKDLRHAKVFVSVMGTEEEKKTSLGILQGAAGFIRREFGHRVSMKVIPEIVFGFDTAVEQGSRIFELLQKVKHESEEPGTSSDS
jgi:ribosome-binding factor A